MAAAEEEDTSSSIGANIPESAWSRRFDEKFSRKLVPLKPTFSQTLPLIPLGLRMMSSVKREKKEGVPIYS
eukprot:gene22009-biopygen7726